MSSDIRATFSINAINIVWGEIEGDLENQTDLVNALNAKQDVISDLDTIRAGAEAGATAIQPNDDISKLNNDANYVTMASIGNGILTIQKNGETVATFGANQAGNETVNIIVPTQASDLDAVPTSRTVNNKALSADISLTASDVGALASTTTIEDLTTSTQQSALNSGATTTNIGQIATNTSAISTINGKIPSAATTTNQLADKAFVNSTVQTNTANYRGNWATWSAVPTDSNDYPVDYSGSKVPTVNDYIVVQDASGYTEETLTGTWRFKYSGIWSTTGKAGWLPEYQVNESPFTQAQLDAINSGATTSNIGQITTNQNAIGTLSSLTTTVKTDLVSAVNELDSDKQDNISDLETIRSGATLGATAIQPNDNITSLTNNAGYITGITSTDVTTALGYTPYDASNPNGYTSNVGTVTSVNNVSPVSGNVTLSIPTDTSDLTNSAGYITSSALSGYQTTSNLVTSISSSSTDTQYPSAKLLYDIVGDIETILNDINSGNGGQP